MIQQFLFVGVGGSGGKTLRALKGDLIQMLELRGWNFKKDGFPAIWQFVHIDTPFAQDGEGFNAKQLEPGEYLGLVNAGVSLDAIIDNLLLTRFSAEQLEEIGRPLPRKGEYTKPVDQGAGQYRAIGRTVAISRLRQIKSKIEMALEAMRGPEAAAQKQALGRLLREEVQDGLRPSILVISSLAGGSGSGQFIDVCEAIKAASPNDQWVHDQTAILFAPDVFKDPKITVNDGIAPNSLAATGELVSGKWRRTRSEVSNVLYSKFGFAEASDASYNTGPKHVFLVGRSNGQISFSSQDEVYNAAATSLAKWVTDSRISENLGAYITNNAQAVADPAGLKVDNHLIPPMNSLGFARVSLGMDLLATYSKQRLARAAVDSLVSGHLKDAKPNELESVTVDRKAQELLPEFFASLKLTPGDTFAAIQPKSKVDAWRSSFTNELSSRAAQGGAQGSSFPAADWIDRINTGFQALLSKFRERWVGERETQKWVDEVQERILAIVAQYSANYGMKVSVKLLENLIKTLKGELSKGAPSIDVKSEQAKLHQGLTSGLAAKNSGALQESNDAVQSAMSLAIQTGDGLLRKDSMVLIHALTKDLVDNFLTPLTDELTRRHKILSDATMDDDYKSTGINVFKSWPNGSSLPAQFKPAQNVRLLVSETTFIQTFEKTLKISVNITETEPALRQAVRELVGGSAMIPELKLQTEASKVAGSSSDYVWKPFENVNPWSPSTGGSNPQSKWSGTFTSELDDWEDKANKYVRIDGRPFGKLVTTDLYAWLNIDDANERRLREDKLVDEFTAILAISKPFAEINRNLHAAAHGGDEPKFSVTMSVIPVDLESTKSELGLRLKRALETKGLWTTDTATSFKGENSGTSTIDVFSTLASPIHHFVYDNLMNPIIERWQEVKSDPAKRQSFMLRRQGRNLPETIPLAPEILERLLRGWYVGKLLGRLDAQTGEPGQGPKLSVFQEDPMKSGWELLPYPLYYPTSTVPVNDFPAVVAASVSIALVECSNKKSMDPFSPYRSLMQLGGEVTVANALRNPDGSPQVPLTIPEVLSEWINLGHPKALCPVPAPERAGSASSTPEARRIAVLAFFKNERKEFDKNCVDLPPGKRHDSMAWELRREIFAALDELIRMVEEVQVSGSGV